MSEINSLEQTNNLEATHKVVETILSENMNNVYLSLDAGVQKIFRLKGEENSQKITQLLVQKKINTEEINKLIMEWLSVIPRVNKYYIEQEAKIKTDKILEIK